MKRFSAILLIWTGCAFACMILGSTLTVRSGEMSSSMRREVHSLWGPEGIQTAPNASFEAAGVDTNVPLEGSELRVALDLEQRRKGLVWFPTYRVDFDGAYRFVNPSDAAQRVTVRIPLMAENVGYDNFVVRSAMGETIPFEIGAQDASVALDFGAHESRMVHVAYRTRGTSRWTYAMANGNGRVKDFSLVMQTDFGEVDFPAGALSPSTHEASGGTWRGEWRFESLISSAPIAVSLPERLNPGPLASKITFFAPVSLLFFFFVVAVLATAQERRLHPMHYFMLGCAFFAFHLLFAYLVDHVSVGVAFTISSVVSFGLVVSYARHFVGWRFALREMGISQFLYLVLFSFSFFWQGFTGLAITIGAVATLFVIMQVTGSFDWEREEEPSKRPPPTPAVNPVAPPLRTADASGASPSGF